jgi:hypothetical protein
VIDNPSLWVMNCFRGILQLCEREMSTDEYADIVRRLIRLLNTEKVKEER